ncbi:hypothetical protein CPB84DRAFT_1295632 [Gymnopilus junonius]|uniref:DUF6535 domain-containing protein n=1 Tax=Gymnopilus junonius TaxID=109634 RepID=A0A9P5TLP3_GYMJU|nr:hypothetical protein CPB84DRAFT_1295632 [Gymnopilus junonius]
MADTRLEPLKPITRRDRRSSSYASIWSYPSSPGSQYTLTQSVDGTELRQPWEGLGSEAGENAQVWHIYKEESTKFDAATIDGCNRGIDVLLVFTGLFSAVLTTFIIQSYQQMLPGPSDTTNALLLQLLSDIRQSSAFNISSHLPPLSSSQTGVPTTSQLHWVNGLWFAALACSLSGALVCMLAKQWIQPLPNISGSPKHRARQRQRRHTQLQSWHVFAVISALPLLLHISLLLFFAGVIILLWSGDIAIMASTFTIVALAYIFYLGSIWMSLAYPDFPYQHPITEQLRRWMARQTARSTPQNSGDLESNSDERIRSIRIPMAGPMVNQDDYVDACSIVWLLQQSSNDRIVKAALQAIAGLPREFSAFHILREAGTIRMVLQQFSCCFHRDHSFSHTKWRVNDAEGAAVYCRAWIRLTHGTSESWPSNLHQPLSTLKDTTGNFHVSAIAACVSALDALDSRTSQIGLLSHINRVASGDSTYDELTQRWLLNTFLECSLSWELRAAVLNDLVKRAVPTLLQLLQHATEKSGIQIRATIALILTYLTQGNFDPELLWDEEKRHLNFSETLIPSLASVIQDPDRFGVTAGPLIFTVSEFSRHAVQAFERSSRFPPHVDTARWGLFKLFIEGRIGIVPDNLLVDILQILHPLDNITSEQKPLFVKALVRTLSTSVDVDVAISSIRLLEPILIACSSSVVNVFMEENGISTLLRVARTGDTDSRRLQLDCLRILCIFIQSSATAFSSENPLGQSRSPALEEQFDIIFQSDFFTTLIATVGGRRWWLSEIAEIWVPALIHLCQVQPQHHLWRSVETVFRDFAEINDGEEGSQRLLDDLGRLRTIIDSSAASLENLCEVLLMILLYFYRWD